MRKAIIEPVFGQIEEQRGFRRFRRRGLDNVRHERKLVCLGSNLLKLFGSGWVQPAA
jgi:Transposase DDE domain